MGRFTLSFFKKIVIASLATSFISAVNARVIQGLNIPESKECIGEKIPLQGAGMRTATLFNIKIYVLAYYAPKKIRISEDFKNISFPVCFDIIYLRDFDNEDVDKAWEFQFNESSEHSYPQLAEHITNLQRFFGSLKKNQKQSFLLDQKGTKVFDDDVLKGEILGDDFKRSFLSLWIGKKPPTKELQDELFK